VEDELMLVYERLLRFPPFGEFDREASSATCSVLVVERPVGEDVALVLRKLSGGGNWSETASWPIVVIEVDAGLSVGAGGGEFPHRIIRHAFVRTRLLDAIPQEVARATLRFLRQRALEAPRLHGSLRRAILVALGDTEPAFNVRALAARAEVGESTLHHHWKTNGLQAVTGYTMGQFLNLVTLLKVRVRKAPDVRFSEAARDIAVSTKHVRHACRALAGYWIRFEDHIGWISLVDMARRWNWGAIG
jgi:hypothetical protein